MGPVTTALRNRGFNPVILYAEYIHTICTYIHNYVLKPHSLILLKLYCFSKKLYPSKFELKLKQIKSFAYLVGRHILLELCSPCSRNLSSVPQRVTLWNVTVFYSFQAAAAAAHNE